MSEVLQRQPRLRRNSLTREKIVAAAMGLFDTHGRESMTFSRLGTELGASPTAVLRHFENRDDILMAVADELDRRALDGYAASADWHDSLMDLAMRAWRTAEKHPAAAVESLFITTGGIHELRAVDAVLEALHAAGYRGREAVLNYQAFANLVLAMSATNASRISRMNAVGDDLLIQEYFPENPADYPYAEAVKVELRDIDHEEVFVHQVRIIINAIDRGRPGL